MPESGYFDAIKAGDLELVRHKVAHDHTLINAREGISAVMTALYYGKPQIAQFLAEQGASLDIFEAAALGDVERLNHLLDEHPDLVNSYAPDGFQALGLAAFFGQKAAVQELLARGANVNAASRNSQAVQPIHSAAAAKRADIVEMLLDHGADANAVQQDGFTPLHAAAENGDLDLIGLLLGRGARRDAATRSGVTPRQLASARGHQEAAALL